MDDKRITGYPDRDLINTSEYYELEYWSNKFGVTPERLKSAIRAVGSSATAVQAYLQK
ncbi:DUF3606 domain-containing protein [Mucilaginibacter xinganensis]|uniref:DUF3606 domain-containing protein n=1 Tax=Mucilaginibacter xinganensis TaxID=1234841 RepID=A0A223NSA8_9SPHI|nr:DUF3606 domain-containing protein [Mucilaginibacter xinganensis]ASU32789.1 DUF3606 domain-containing protein [Mucilaginibacter xinganensis]